MSARKALTIAILLSVSLFLLVQTTAGQEVSLDISGDCQEYSVTLSASGLDNGCYDAKIDITSPSGRVGEIYDPQKGWKSYPTVTCAKQALFKDTPRPLEK